MNDDTVCDDIRRQFTYFYRGAKTKRNFFQEWQQQMLHSVA